MKSIQEAEPYCYCYACGRYGQLEEHHIFYGRKQRQMAEKQGLKVHLCQLCHGKGREGVHGGNTGLNMWLKEIAQAAFEETHTREEFMALFGKNYIGVKKMNQVILMGRLTRDPELRYINQDNPRPVANYTLAVDRKGKAGGDSQNADFIKVAAFDRAAEFADRYFRKGMRVLVSGRIVTGSYTGKNGQKVYTTEVYATDQEFADSKGAAVPKEPEPEGVGFMKISDGVESDLPFDM